MTSPTAAFAAYLAQQRAAVLGIWNRDYDVLDVPPVAYGSWEEARHQTRLVADSTGRRLSWRPFSGPARRPAAMALEEPGVFPQLWVRSDATSYREIAMRFVRDRFGVPPGGFQGHQADHVFPRGRAAVSSGDAVTWMLWVPWRANVTWGAGEERRQTSRGAKVRDALTIVNVAKVLGIEGPSAARGRTLHDVARELGVLGAEPKGVIDHAPGTCMRPCTVHLACDLAGALGRPCPWSGSVAPQCWVQCGPV